MIRVYANGRSIVHSRDGLVDVAGPPDVCKTPTPPAPQPVPVPYVNAARSADLARAARQTTIEGGAVALASSFIAISTGDEPGIAGGVISGRVRGKLRWQSTSLDVKVEGKGVARFTDAVSHNGNTFNTSFIQQGRTGWAYGDDRVELCPICGKGPDSHRVPETARSKALAADLLRALQDAHREYETMQAELDRRTGEIMRLEAEKAAADEQRRQEAGSRADAGEPSAAGAKGKGKKSKAPVSPEAQLLADAQKSRTEFERSRAGIRVQRPGTGGYMIGVMVCKENKTFAAMSGKSIAGFNKVVADLGWNLCDGTVGMDNFNHGLDETRKQRLQRTWDQLDEYSKESRPGYNRPGVCAAPKLIALSKLPPVPAAANGSDAPEADRSTMSKEELKEARARDKERAKAKAEQDKKDEVKRAKQEKHIPLCMTETFFSPGRAPHPIRIRYQHSNRWVQVMSWISRGYYNPVWREAAFEIDCTVPSCMTCQTLVPLALCDVDTRTCSAVPGTPATALAAGPSKPR